MHIHIESKSYGGDPVLRDVNLTLNTQSRIAITGTSGTGKSTLLRIIAGLDDDFEGTIEARPQALGIVFQEPLLMNWKSAIDNLVLVTNTSLKEASYWLDKVGLSGLEQRLPQELSIGQQRRVSLARAFSANPKLLILDEAFASLDQGTTEIMHDLVSNYLDSQDCGLILATHQHEDLKLTLEEYTLEAGNLILKS